LRWFVFNFRIAGVLIIRWGRRRFSFCHSRIARRAGSAARNRFVNAAAFFSDPIWGFRYSSPPSSLAGERRVLSLLVAWPVSSGEPPAVLVDLTDERRPDGQ